MPRNAAPNAEGQTLPDVLRALVLAGSLAALLSPAWAFDTAPSWDDLEAPLLESEPPRAEARPSPVTAGSYLLPGRLTSPVGWRIDPIRRDRWTYHRGWDIAMPAGTPVRPSLPGVVTYSGWWKGFGNLVQVDHRNGFATRYSHLRERLVQPGQEVTTATVIGRVGSTGASTGPHLDYRVIERPPELLRPVGN